MPKKDGNFFKKNYRDSLKYIKKSKEFIYIVIVFFLIFFFLGFLFPTPKVIEEKILEFIKELLKATEGMSWLELTNYIFVNNLQSSFFAIILGIFLGFYSVATAIINGYLLGFVALKVVQKEGFLVLWRLIPHGIFELPALFISTGLGLKLGTVIIKNSFRKISGINKINFKECLLNSIKTFFFVIVPLLIIAAFIEGSLIFLLG